ncbi:hypothetical protein KBY58_11900 [Cyanobium sp. HWJ4-Hawea]|uniref:hypothetical protein n=1 Tax=Cyanobium sp. HWJ4-Hawea TaxID=2823713 RepID=UPI0020CC706D|nr:hypothetical protein [Cyanobium sp. HWJ4-Hawea]MCP9810135.1 hypothetical protein [Cyanobium sp. HWJ4-Hawea]
MRIETKMVAGVIVACTQMITPGQLSAGEKPTEIRACQSVSPANYIVLGYGIVHNLPAGRVLKERWNADGSIEGMRINRDGDKLLEADYRGSWKQLLNCEVEVRRINGTRASETRDIIDLKGHASRALSFTPGTTLGKQYWLNKIDQCTNKTLQGQWIGEFSGKVLKGNKWQPYEAVGKLIIEGTRLQGSLISSKAGKLETTEIEGIARLESSCFGKLQWRDQEGRSRSERLLISGDGQRVILLRTDPSLFSIGLIEKEK